MQRFLIICGIILVGYLAVSDTIARFKELDVIVINRTPSQEEMKSDIIKSKGSGLENSHQNNPPSKRNYEQQKNGTEREKEQFQKIDIKQPVILDNNP